MTPENDPRALLSSKTVVLVRRTITAVVIIIAALSFAFSFGSGLALGLALGAPRWIAGLVTPAVDLSVLALITAIQYIRAQGITSRLVGARLLLVFSGLVTLVINTGRAASERQFGRAAFDAVAPLLLIFWGEVGPGLLALLHHPIRDEQRTVRDEIGPSAELIARARELDAQRREAAGRPISRDRMRAALGVSNVLAGELVRIVRSTEDGATQ